MSVTTLTIASFFLTRRDHARARWPRLRVRGSAASGSEVGQALWVLTHWYLILGSTMEYAMSARRLAITKAAAPISVIAIITG